MAEIQKFLDFPSATKQQWKEQVLKELKGKEFESLLWQTEEGFSLEPLYTAEEVKEVSQAYPKHRLGSEDLNAWTILQEYKIGSLQERNERILTSLNAGVQGLVLKAKCKEDYQVTLKGVFLTWIKIYIETKNGKKDLDTFLSYTSDQKIDLRQLKGGLVFDPLNDLLKYGKWNENENTDLKNIIETCKLGTELPQFTPLLVNGSLYGDSGATIVNELAYSLALYHEYLLILLNGGIEASHALEAIQITLSIGRSYYLEIAKIKVFRLLHAQLLDVYGIEKKEVNIISKSSKFVMAPVDQYNNLLRLTTQAMAAGIGGADDILLSTFDGQEDIFSQRMSTNIQLLLLEESFFDKGTDVSSGAYAFEEIISKLGKKVWEKFQEIEEEGGWLSSVSSGILQSDIREDAQEKIQMLTEGKSKWVGVNVFKNVEEKEWKTAKIEQDRGQDFEKLCQITHQY